MKFLAVAMLQNILSTGMNVAGPGGMVLIFLIFINGLLKGNSVSIVETSLNHDTTANIFSTFVDISFSLKECFKKCCICPALKL